MLTQNLYSGLPDGFTGDWDLATVDPYLGLEEPDYGKFENVCLHLA